MNKTFKSLLHITAITLPVVLGGSNVFAQSLDEIVVTARKRAENLQKTPVSVVAMTADKLEQQNISTISGMEMKTPNVAIGGAGGLGSSNASFYIRGIGTARNAVNQESAVALYVDDAYFGRSDGAILSVVDVERVEVLRGPQGTLFGRNATSGAIRYITKKPGDEFGGKVQATFGSYSRMDLKGAVNIPIGDSAAIRFTGATLNRDGHVKRTDGLDLGDVGTNVARAYLRWDATDALEVLANVDYTRIDTNGTPSVLLDINPNAPWLLQEAAAGFDIRNLPTDTFYTSYGTGKNLYESDNLGLNLVVNYDFGGAQLKSVTTHRDMDITFAYDVDGTHAALFEQDGKRDIQAFSQELQLTGTSMDDRLNWLLGAFYYDEEARDVRLTINTANAARNRTTTRITNPITTESWAVFGQGTFDVTDRFSVTAGLRYTEDEKEIFAQELNAAGAPILLTDASGTKDHVLVGDSWSRVTGRLSLEYDLTDNVFGYASFARGFRSGGFNDRIRSNLPNDNFGISPFDEEVLDTYEAGIRSDLLDDRLRLNLTAFTSRFKDIQFAALIPGTNRAVVQNAAKGEISGLEGDFAFAVTDMITLDGAIGLMDAKYTDLAPTLTSITLDSDFGRAPDLSYALGIQGEFPFAEGTLTPRLDWGWKDDFRLLEADNPAIIQKAYGLLSFNIGYTPKSDRWTLSAFGTNVTDEEYLISGINLIKGAPHGVIQAEPGRPAEYGAKLEVRF